MKLETRIWILLIIAVTLIAWVFANHMNATINKPEYEQLVKFKHHLKRAEKKSFLIKVEGKDFFVRIKQ